MLRLVLHLGHDIQLLSTIFKHEQIGPNDDSILSDIWKLDPWLSDLELPVTTPKDTTKDIQFDTTATRSRLGSQTENKIPSIFQSSIDSDTNSLTFRIYRV